MIGKTILNYRVTSFIDEGGMGSVYSGIHLKLDRKVAIKILHKSFTANPQFKERFLNEAKMLARLSHQNIIGIYDFIEHESDYYIITEFVEGKTLDNLLRSIASLSSSEILNIFKQVLNGIGYAHSCGIIHRDIKPSNVIIDNNGNARILDFGIAKLIDSSSNMTKTGTKMGSLFYMSPEQVLGKPVDNRTDIYSLGVVLFEMFAKKLPYKSDTNSDYEVMNSILNEEIQDIDLYVKGVDENIQSAIQKACAKNPSDRFNSCEEFGEALCGNFITEERMKNSQSTHRNTGRRRTDKTVVDEIVTSNIPLQNSGQSSAKLWLGIVSGVLIIGIVLLWMFLADKDKNTSASDSDASGKNKSDLNVKGTELKDMESTENKESVTKEKNEQQNMSGRTNIKESNVNIDLKGNYSGTIKDGTRWNLSIDFFDGENISGSNVIYWAKYPEGFYTKFTGRYEPSGSRITLYEDINVKGAGVFNGTVSADGLIMSGEWRRNSDGGVYLWNLRR